jgi:hypothetical protein
MANEAIIEKIKKLFALSNSPSEAEALLAMEKANHLLKEYNLSISDIKEDNRFSLIEEAYSSCQKERTWRTVLIQIVCKANFCTLVQYNFYKKKEFHIVGKKHNIVVAKEMIAYLESAIERISKEVSGTYRNSFKLGIVSRLAERFKEIEKRDEPESKALVVQEFSAIKQYLSEQNFTNQVVTYRPSNSSAYYQGLEAGSQISLNSQVSSNSNTYVGIGA